MKYLVVDGMLNGTGVRDKYNGGYVSLDSLRLPADLKIRIESWLNDYKQEHYNEYRSASKVNELDNRGIEISKQIKSFIDSKVVYFSSATLKEQEI